MWRKAGGALLAAAMASCDHGAAPEVVDASTEQPLDAWVDALRTKFVAAGVDGAHQIIVEAEATRIDRGGSVVRAFFGEVESPARLPNFADGAIELAVPRARVRVKLLRTDHVPARVGKAVVTYDDAVSGGTLFHVPTDAGTEEYVLLHRAPKERALRYAVELDEAAGLRLVGNTLEILDASGDPRLRTTAPWIVDARGTLREGTIAIEGCAYDRNEAGPWGRAVVDPGARSCEVIARFDDRDLTYPILIDPAWSDTSKLASSRTFHRSTFVTKAGVCAGGCVLASGGNFNDVLLTSAELYNVTAGTWATAGSIPGGARWLHASEPTGDGRVLVAGGCTGLKDFDDPGTASAAIYDPAAGWTAIAPMKAARGTHMGASANKRVFMSGGGNKTGAAGAFVVLNTAEEYNFATNTWSNLANMSSARRLHGSVAWSAPAPLSIIVAGGYLAGTLSSVEVWSGGTWTARGALNGPRYGMATVDVGNHVIFAGGLPSTGTPSPRIDDYDKIALTTTPFGSDLSVGRGLLAGAPFTVGTVTRALFAGGTSAVGTGSNQGVVAADTVDVATAKAYPHAMKYRRAGATATPIGGGRVLVVGGRYGVTSAPPTYSAPAKEEIFAPSVSGACTDAIVGECSSLKCVDGYCCDSDCTDQCAACNVPGKLGKCSPVPAGTQAVLPRAQCTPFAGKCGYSCDGTNTKACGVPPATTVCQDATCGYNTSLKAFAETKAAYCTGSGSCALGGVTPVSCGAYTCSGTACRKTCTAATSTTDCAAGYTCKSGLCQTTGDNGTVCTRNDECKSMHCVDGVCCSSASCTAPNKCNANGKGTCSKPLATKCALGTECGTGYCIDGVCCDAACTGQCAACNIGGSEGHCAAVAGSPVGTRPACPGTGKCQSKCDGATTTACKAYPAGETPCVDASCSAGVETAQATCNGKGGCNTAKTTTCEPYVCAATACKVTCTTGADCTAGYVCKSGNCETSGALGTLCGDDAECTSKHCVGGQTPDKNVCCSVATCPAGTYCAGVEAGTSAGKCLKERAETCTMGKECGSGFCFDGVCCDRACTGQCEACDIPGAEGICSGITGAPHGTRTACDDGGPNVCRALACDGDKSVTTCLSYKNGPSKECAPAKCEDGVVTEASFCNGEGGCITPDPKSCGAYLCDATACKTSCTATADCATGYTCVSNKCIPAEAPRPTCTADKGGSIPPEGGAARACAPYQCNPSTGDCFTECTTSDVCTSGNVCDGNKCIPGAAAPTEESGGCGCTLPGRDRSSHAALLIALLVISRASRRRDR